MSFSSRDETCDSNTPWGSSSSSPKSTNEGNRLSYQGSISNSSLHTVSTADTHNDPSELSGQCPPRTESPTGQYSSMIDIKSFHSFEKPTYHSRNQSLSSICTTRARESNFNSNFDCGSDSGGSTPPSTPRQDSSSPLSLPALEDEAEFSLPPTPSRSPPAVLTPQVKTPNLSPSPGPSPVIAPPRAPFNGSLIKSYTDPPLFATTGISAGDTPTVGPTPSPTDRIRTRPRASTVTSKEKEKKGLLGFMHGLRKSVDFRDSNKRLEVTEPFEPVHIQRVGFGPITGKLHILPKKLQELFHDRISEHDQEKDSLAAMEFSHNNDNMTSAGLRVPRFQRPLSEDFKNLTLPLPKKGHSRAHSSSVSQARSPALYHPYPPQPIARPNLDLSSSQQALLELPRIDTVVHGNATGHRRSPVLQGSAKTTPTTPTTSPVTGRRAQPTTAPQRRSVVAASLAKSAGATPRRREKKKKSKSNDADLMKRLQGICRNGDPTLSYRNLVKIGQG